MKDNKYTPDVQEKMDKIADRFRTLKKILSGTSTERCYWFQDELRVRLSRFLTQSVAGYEAQAFKMQCKPEEIMNPDKPESHKEMAGILKRPLIAQLEEDIQYVLNQISQKRISPYQVEEMNKAAYAPAGGVNLDTMLERLRGSPDGLPIRETPLSIWNLVRSLRKIPREAPLPVPRTWKFPKDHADKTDKVGLPYYFPKDALTGYLIQDEALVSQTSEAMRMRRRAYKAPSFSAEQYAEADKKTAKANKKKGEDYLKEKNAQRAKAREDRGEAISDSLRNFERDGTKAQAEYDARQKKNKEDYGKSE